MSKEIIDLLEKTEYYSASRCKHCFQNRIIIQQVLETLKQQPTAGEPKCKTCGDKKKVEVCDNCYPNKTTQLMQQTDSYPKLIRCMICGKGKPKEISCPDCQQPTAGEWTKLMRERYKYAIDKKLCVSAVVFKEACDRLDRAEAINKDLLEALENALVSLTVISMPRLDNNVATDAQLLKIMGDSFRVAITKAKKE